MPNNRRQEVEQQRQDKIRSLEAIADNELTAPVFRGKAERQLDELGVGKNSEPIGRAADVISMLDEEND